MTTKQQKIIVAPKASHPSYRLLLITLLLSNICFLFAEGKGDAHHLRHRRRVLHGMHASNSNDDHQEEETTTTADKYKDMDDDIIVPAKDTTSSASYMDIIVNKEQQTHPIPPPPHKKKKKKKKNYNSNDEENDSQKFPHKQANQLPEYLATHLTNLTIPFQHLTDVPLFLHIPKSGGTLIKYHYGKCLNLVESTQHGKDLSTHHDSLETVTDPKTDIRYVNVDTTHVEGIKQAKELGVVSTHLADVIFTSFLYESLTELFDVLHPGKLFLLLRHPIEREVSLFYYKQKALWEQNSYNPTWKNITIEEYALEGMGTSNPLVRMLTKPNGHDTVVTENDLQLAKLILKDKALIGLSSRMEESVLNFDRYFGWYNDADERANACRKHLVQHGLNVNHHDMVEERSVAWNALFKRNALDMELYDYALGLYESQKERLQMGTLNVER